MVPKPLYFNVGLPWLAPSVKDLPAVQESQFLSCGREDPWRTEWQPTPVFLPGNPMKTGAWRAAVHGVAESDVT